MVINVMTLAALAFIGYTAIFLVHKFTGALHTVVSGLIAATGLAVAVLARFGHRRRYVWGLLSSLESAQDEPGQRLHHGRGATAGERAARRGLVRPRTGTTFEAASAKGLAPQV